MPLDRTIHRIVVSLVLLNAGPPGLATACIQQLPYSTGSKIALLPTPQNGFTLRVFGATSGFALAGDRCGGAIGTPIGLVDKYGCSATALRLTEAANVYGTLTDSPTTAIAFETEIQSHGFIFPGEEFLFTGFATTVADTTYGAEVDLEI